MITYNKVIHLCFHYWQVKKKLFRKPKHSSKKKLLTTDSHNLYKSEDTLEVSTLQPQIYKAEVQDSTTLSPVVEMPDGTIPIRVTYQNPHVHVVDGMEKKFKLVELQTGNPNYHGHPDEKILQNIIYQGQTKGNSETKNNEKQILKLKLDSTKNNPKNKYEISNKFGTNKNYKIINNMNNNSRDTQDDYEQFANKTSTIKLVIQKKINETVILHENSTYLNLNLTQKQENKLKYQNYNNKFGDIRINLRKKCNSNNCLQGSIANKKIPNSETKKQFNLTSEENILETTEMNRDIYYSNITRNYDNLTIHIENVNITSVVENDNKNCTNDKEVIPLVLSENIKYPPLNNRSGINLLNALKKSSVDASNSFKMFNFNDTILSNNMEIKSNIKIKNEDQNNQNYSMGVSSSETIISNTTARSLFYRKNTTSNIEQWNEPDKIRNKEIFVGSKIKGFNTQNFTTYLSDDTVVPIKDEPSKNTSEPNINIGNLTESVYSLTNSLEEIVTDSTYLNTSTSQHILENELNLESAPIEDDSKEIYVDDNLYNNISQEVENKSEEFNDEKSDDELLEKMAAHYRKLLPWVNYTLSGT